MKYLRRLYDHVWVWWIVWRYAEKPAKPERKSVYARPYNPDDWYDGQRP